MELGKKAIQMRVLAFYVRKYGANINWLLTGEGEMFLPSAGQTAPRLVGQRPATGGIIEEMQTEIEALRGRLDKLENIK